VIPRWMDLPTLSLDVLTFIKTGAAPLIFQVLPHFLTLFMRYRRAAAENKITVEPVLTNEVSLTVDIELPQRLFTEQSKMDGQC